MESNSATPQQPQRDGQGAGGGPLSRRTLLKAGGIVLGGAVLAPALAACGGGSGGTGSSGGGSTGSGSTGGGSTGGATGSAAASKGASAGGGKGKVTVWWNSGFYDSEDQAVKAVAQDFEKQSGYTVDLQFYSTKDIPTKEQSAITAGVLPDVVMAENGNTATYAYQGHLADVSSVVGSQHYPDAVTSAVTLYDSTASKSGIYAVPINQFTVPLFYWKDMLKTAGSDPSSIPGDWTGFWKYFEDAQGAYRTKTGKKNVYAVGWPMSTSAGDTHYDTQMALMAFNAMVLDDKGHLQAEQAKPQIVKALSFLAGLYQGGWTPKDCVNWDDSGNNTAFSNKTIILTPNGSLSIPGAVKGKDNAAWENIVTQPFPTKPDGSGPVPSMAQVHNAVVFKKSPNVQGGMAFLKFFIEPANTLKYLKGGHGRWHPAQTDVLSDPYFAKSDDPNIATATKMLTGPTQPAWLNISVAYNHAELQGMWGTALGMIVLQGKSADDAAAYAIGQLTESFKSFPVK